MFFSSPLRKRMCSAVQLQHGISARVIRLLNWRTPFTIARSVTGFIADSVYGAAARFFSHVSKEILKLKPSFANCYSTSAIIRIGRFVRIETSAFHGTPRSVSRRVPHPVPSVGTIGNYFFFQTSARAHGAVSKCCRLFDGFFSAVTSTQPFSAATSCFAGTKGNQAAKSLVSYVEFFHPYKYSYKWII